MIRGRYVAVAIAVVAVVAVVLSTTSLVVAQSVPPIVIKPSMKVYVFDEGTFAIRYLLDIIIRQNKSPTGFGDGSATIYIHYFEDDDKAGISVRGGGSFVTGEVGGTASSKFMIESSGGCHGKSLTNETKLVINALASLTVMNETPTKLNKTDLKANKLSIEVTPDTIDAYFIATLTGTKPKISLPLGKDSSSLMNSKLVSSGITYVKFKKLIITQVNNTIKVEGEALVDIKELLSKGTQMHVLTSDDVKKVRWCVEEGIRDLRKVAGKYEFFLLTSKFANGASSTKFKIAADLILGGDIKAYKNVSRECSKVFSKLGLVASLAASQASASVGGGKVKVTTPPPAVMEKFAPTKLPQIEAVHPYRSEVVINVKASSGKLYLRIDLSTGKLKWVGNASPTELVKKGLTELRDYLSDFSRKLSFLELMGVKSPIPSTIEVNYMTKGKVVSKEIASLSDLPYVGAKLVAKGAVVTVTLPTPPTTIPTKTIVLKVSLTKATTVTKTVTVTVSKEVTSIITKTFTVTQRITNTLTSTTTVTTTKYVEKPVIGTTNLILIGGFAVVIAALVTALARRR